MSGDGNGFYYLGYAYGKGYAHWNLAKRRGFLTGSDEGVMCAALDADADANARNL